VRAFAVDSAEAPVEGAGDVQSGHLTWRTLISGDRTPSEEIILGVADFPPHGTLNMHRHAPAEVYFGLSGEGVVTVNGVPFKIAQGIAVYIPGNTDHGVVAGERGLSFVYGFARDSFASILYQFRDETPPRALT